MGYIWNPSANCKSARGLIIFHDRDPKRIFDQKIFHLSSLSTFLYPVCLLYPSGQDHLLASWSCCWFFERKKVSLFCFFLSKWRLYGRNVSRKMPEDWQNKLCMFFFNFFSEQECRNALWRQNTHKYLQQDRVFTPVSGSCTADDEWRGIVGIVTK